jgi:hypothetical protein
MQVFRCVAVLVLFLWVSACEGREHHLAMTIVKSGNGYDVTVRNVSSSSVPVPDHMYLANPGATGYWLFLYDPARKSIQYASSHGIGSPRMMAMRAPSHALAPGASETNHYEAEYIYGLFHGFPSGRCVYVLVKYKDRLIESPSSAPVFVCRKASGNQPPGSLQP